MSAEKKENEEKQEDSPVKKDLKHDKKLIDHILGELEDIEYYHGNMLDEEMKTILPQKGDFILRNRLNGDVVKEILLTLNWNDAIVDVKMRAKLMEGKVIYTFDGKTRKTSIKEIIQKHQYSNTAISHKGMNIMLLNPIAKQAWELKKESVEVMKKLGEGAFGEVWMGRLKMRMARSKEVAIKVIKKTANNEKATTELQKEGSLMRKFTHVNVVRTYGMVIERDTIMVVMELINGGGLNDYVKKNKLTMEEKGMYALDIANGLEYLHSLKCIHRDIALRNCLIDLTKKQAKVADFGLTRQTETYKVQATDRLPIRWTAPEVLRTFEYTRAADVYAYGILTWEIFTDGAIPFGDMNNAMIKEGIQKDECRPKFPEGTPSDVIETIAKCWTGDVKSRLEMGEVKKGLTRYKRTTIEDLLTPLGDSGSSGGSGGSGGEKEKEKEKEGEKKSAKRTKKKKDKEKSVARTGKKS